MEGVIEKSSRSGANLIVIIPMPVPAQRNVQFSSDTPLTWGDIQTGTITCWTISMDYSSNCQVGG